MNAIVSMNTSMSRMNRLSRRTLTSTNTTTITHQDRYEVECVAVDREAEDATRPGKVVGEALLRLLYRKGVVTPAELHKSVEALETANVSLRAADLVVRAWKDAAFKERLVKDGEFVVKSCVLLHQWRTACTRSVCC
jgi:hypothetical protein